jgi:hypothetical protein
VNHLDVVTGTGFTNPVTAGFVISLGSDRLENGLNVGPGSVGTTGHEGRTIASTFLTTRDTGADEKNTLLLKVFSAANGVREVRVTTVNDDITLLEVGKELLDEIVNGRTSLDKEHDLAWALKLGAKFLDGVSSNNLGAYEERGKIQYQPSALHMTVKIIFMVDETSRKREKK